MPSKPDPSDPPHVPTALKAQHVAAAVKATIGADFVKMIQEAGVDLEGMAAMVPLAAALRDERKRRGHSYAEAAKALKTTQKALKAIEAGAPGGMDGAVLVRYVGWLRFTDYLRQWAQAQPALAERLGLRAEWRSGGQAPGAGGLSVLPVCRRRPRRQCCSRPVTCSRFRRRATSLRSRDSTCLRNSRGAIRR